MFRLRFARRGRRRSSGVSCRARLRTRRCARRSADAQSMKSEGRGDRRTRRERDQAGAADHRHGKRSQLVPAPTRRPTSCRPGSCSRAHGARRRAHLRTRHRRSRRGQESGQQHEPLRSAKLPDRYMSRSRPPAYCSASNGRGRFQLESASVGACRSRSCCCRRSWPTTRRAPTIPDGISLDDEFELPARIREIQVQRGQAIVVQ